MKRNSDRKSVTQNRKARHDFVILETWEAGLVLLGTEVKSLREGKCTLGDAYVRTEKGEAFLCNLHIPEYVYGHQFNHEPKRRRKLLLHPPEIEKIRHGTERDGHTCIPIEVYFVKGKVKVELALAQGRKKADKREAAKADEDRREMRKVRIG